MTTPKDVKRLRSLVGGLSHHGISSRTWPSTHVLRMNVRPRKNTTLEFTPWMKATVRSMLADLAKLLVMVYPNWNAVEDSTRPFLLHTDTSYDGLGSTLGQEQGDGTIRPMAVISEISTAIGRKAFLNSAYTTCAYSPDWNPWRLEATTPTASQDCLSPPRSKTAPPCGSRLIEEDEGGVFFVRVCERHLPASTHRALF